MAAGTSMELSMRWALRGFRPNVLGRDYWNAWELAVDDRLARR